MLQFFTDHILAVAITALHVTGVLAGFYILMNGRTAQGTIAWLLSLVFLPYLTIPLFLILGSHKFRDYVAARRDHGLDVQRKVNALDTLHPMRAFVDPRGHGDLQAMERLARLPLTTHNDCRLLIDGAMTFEALFRGIDQAEHYLLVQFFIIRDDALGQALSQRLINKARAGVRVYLLYDDVGCKNLPASYLGTLSSAGVRVSAFGRRRARPAALFDRFRLNFRNHRKIVVVDGRIAWVGGHNVGVEYLGQHPRLSPWRDTHVELTGPAVLACQVAFVEDWQWATGRLPDLDWVPRPAVTADRRVLVVPTGPADDLETCSLLFVQAINQARQRLWIVSPYFVPDDQVVAALQLAALRGVDVRILLPARPDHKLVWLAGYSYLEETDPLGIKLYRYQRGFLHQKVMLVDDDLAIIGTANCDNRSFRINFEISIVVADREFAHQVAGMLSTDFSHSRRSTLADYRDQPLYFRMACRASRLLAPIL